MTECRYCVNAHDVRELCRARRVSRRKFLFGLGATVAAVAAAPLVPNVGFTIERTIRWPTQDWGALPEAVIAAQREMNALMQRLYQPLIVGDLNEPRPVEKWLAEHV